MVTWHGILGQDGSEELRSQKCINWARLSRAQKQGDQVDIGEVCKLLVTGVSKSHTVIAIQLYLGLMSGKQNKRWSGWGRGREGGREKEEEEGGKGRCRRRWQRSTTATVRR